MTENPSKYVKAGGNNHPTNDISDAIDWLDTVIKADEADVLEILENAGVASLNSPGGSDNKQRN